jgi:hypothetical protein
MASSRSFFSALESGLLSLVLTLLIAPNSQALREWLKVNDYTALQSHKTNRVASLPCGLRHRT